MWASYKRRTWNHLVIHLRKFTGISPSLLLPTICGHVKGKLCCPPELTILLVHNYEYEPIMVKSLRYTGIENFTVLKPQTSGPWRHSTKLVTIRNYLNSVSCKTEYILFCDSNDAVLRDDPGKAIRYLEEENCDLLFSRTKFKGGYECIPHIKTWADQLAKQHDSSGWYINSGVYIVRTHFYRQVLEAAMTYITEDDLPGKVYGKLRRDGGLGERLPEFPKGCGSDQVIFRYLHSQFYPQIKIDYQGRLALR